MSSQAAGFYEERANETKRPSAVIEIAVGENDGKWNMTREWEGRWIAGLRREAKPETDQSIGEGEYLRVSVNGQVFHGGNQTWWLEKGKKANDIHKRGSLYQKCRRDENDRLARLGCGVIAMNDLELFLLSQLAQGRYGRPGGEKSAPEISRQEYVKYVAVRWQKAYHINGDALNCLTGLYPWKMERGIRAFLLENGLVPEKIRWAPRWHEKSSVLKKEVIVIATRMLQENLPVIFSYHTFDKKDGLVLYERLEQAVLGEGNGLYPVAYSHYMTIIGLYEYWLKGDENDASREDAIRGYILQVVSWGRIYFVRYDDYAKKLNYFTNILEIRIAKG